jgi:hypothetical protein
LVKKREVGRNKMAGKKEDKIGIKIGEKIGNAN